MNSLRSALFSLSSEKLSVTGSENALSIQCVSLSHSHQLRNAWILSFSSLFLSTPNNAIAHSQITLRFITLPRSLLTFLTRRRVTLLALFPIVPRLSDYSLYLLPLFTLSLLLEGFQVFLGTFTHQLIIFALSVLFRFARDCPIPLARCPPDHLFP